MNYKHFSVEIEKHIAHVRFNRPEKANALDEISWKEMREIFEKLNENEEVRAVVLSGEGKHFCAGIDLSMLMEIGMQNNKGCEGRKREKILKSVKGLQASINAIEDCRKPVLAAIHGGCIGGGLDIVCACDMRYCTGDAYFTIKEIDMGMVADLGTLQRLPKIIPDGIARELAYTGRKMYGQEAAQTGLVNSSFSEKAEMMEEVMKIASGISGKSPLSIRGTKEMLLYARDHSVEEGLRYMAAWNAAMILSDDLMVAFQAAMRKQTPVFEN